MPDEQTTGPAAHPQVVVVYERDDTLIAYATAYSDYACGEAIEDCRAKYGNAKLIMGKETD
jgi:hypothetical protein